MRIQSRPSSDFTDHPCFDISLTKSKFTANCVLEIGFDSFITESLIVTKFYQEMKSLWVIVTFLNLY
jgi:hypothetical protein